MTQARERHHVVERDGMMRHRSVRRVARVVYVVADVGSFAFIALLIGTAVYLALIWK